MQTLTAQSFSFGDFKLDGGKRLLLEKGESVSLNSKTFDLLLALVENHGRILSKDELLEKVWAGQFVEENNLTVHISALRKIFGEKKGKHQFILTIPGTGYSFIHEVREDAGNALFKTNLSEQISDNFDERDRLIGRATEIAEIKDILRASNKCLLTLTGAGGSGKTKLAQTIAAEMQTEFADGVFFVELAAVGRAELVLGAIAQALDVKESGEKSVLNALKDFLRKREILLILDNFEQLLSAANLLKELLDSTANLKILVTSRTLLRLKFEQEKIVLPLNIPPRNSNLSAEELAAFSAVELFALRAQTAKSSFALNNENASFIAEICQKLDGLPLAIELAAARVKLLSPQPILERLENSLKLLTGGAKDLPEHQQTMRGTIRWSYDLLDEDEKDLFRRLAVFAGGFTVEAAEAVLSDDSALDLLVSLIDNNLLIQKDLPDGNARLQMLEVVREFALEMLQTNGEIDDLQRIHAHYFLSVAEEAEPFLYAEKGNEWLEKLESEHDNFRAALSWSLKNEHETAARIAADLNHFWEAHSHFSEGLGWCKAALQVTEKTISKSRCKLLQAIATYLKHRGEFDAARQHQEIGLTESRELNDLPQIHKAIQGLGGIAVVQKDYASAELFYAEALALSRQINDRKQIAFTLGSFGDLEMCRGNYSAARILIEECRTLSEPGNNPVNTVTYYNLGAVDYFENRYEDAARNFARSLHVCVEIGFKSMMSCALDGFAALAAVGGNYELSAKLAGAVDSLRESISYHNEPAEEDFRADYLTKVRAAVDKKTYDALYEQGKGMSLDETLAVAKVFDSEFVNGLRDHTTEIIIENHSFSRIIIEEEFESEV